MSRPAVRSWLSLALVLIALTGCADALWVERLDVTVDDDLSSRVRFIVLQGQESVQADLERGATPFAKTVQEKWVTPCDIATHDYRGRQGAFGFLAIVEYAHKDDLEHALTCVEVLSQIVKIRPLKVEEGLLDANYELQLDFMMPEAFREVQITLPGTIHTYEVRNARHREITARLISPDTVLWRIATPDQSSQPATTPVSSDGPDATPTAAADSQSAEPVSLIARARVWKIDTNLIVSILGFLFGGGILVQLVQVRKRKSGGAAA
ncbi:MAG TPA: hypothetical protein VNL77_13430 [Roseiflexaceae bacterium]|nr:hypothetical protein [Roseiflexaceae bacterium]